MNLKLRYFGITAAWARKINTQYTNTDAIKK